MAIICKYKELINLRSIAARCMSTAVDPQNQSAFKRGTGGRSSFNGVVATVFGATGHLGRNVMAKLGKRGTQIIVPYRDDEYAVMKLKTCGDLGQILFSPFHLKDEESIYKVMKYSNVVINIIEKNFETPNFSFNDVHVEGAQRIARIARECGVKRMVHLSAINASPNPPPLITPKGSEYNRTKWYGEQAVREELPDATIIRPSWFYGLEGGIAWYYMSMWRRFFYRIYLWNKGKGIYKYPVFVSDLAQGLVNAALDPTTAGKVYQGIGPYRYELDEMVNFLFRLVLHPHEQYHLYHLGDMRKAYHYWMIVNWHQMCSIKRADVTWEKLEMEHASEQYDSSLPTLEDLGVKLTSIETRFLFESQHYRPFMSYEPEFGEIDMEEVPLPKRAPYY